jgi:hypothetical protein
VLTILCCSMRRGKRKRTVTVRKEWFGLFPKRGRHVMFWLEVAHRVVDRHVRSTNYNVIKQICMEVDYEFRHKENNR